MDTTKRQGRNGATAVVLVGAALILAGCAAGPNDVSQLDAVRLAGFWPGLWHGAIYPITFFVSLFNKNVNIYEVHNNGGWYNFGFVFGIALMHAIVDAPRRGRRRMRRREVST